MAFENKKQLVIIVAAVAIGIVAVVLTSNYVKNTIQDQTAALSEKYEAQQKEAVAQIQQRNDQQMAALAQALQRVKEDDAQELRTQIAALKATQAAQGVRSSGKPVVHKPSLALKTPVGKRAVTVKIDSLAAVGGLINAGDMVDVIAQLNMPSAMSDKNTLTAMIFQNLEILAINTNENEPGAYDEQQAASSLKITFAVDPQEAGLLAFADKNGGLELALRSPDDSDRLAVKADTWKTLADYVLKNQGIDIENPDNVPASRPEEARPNIQIFRGGKEL